MNMNDQYLPERDRLRVQVLKILAILVAMLLIMALLGLSRITYGECASAYVLRGDNHTIPRFRMVSLAQHTKTGDSVIIIPIHVH